MIDRDAVGALDAAGTPTARLVHDWNLAYWDGMLAPEAVEELANIDGATPDALENIDRAFRLLRASAFEARDVTALLTWQLATLIPGFAVGAWNGTVPAITGADRHARLDEYIAANTSRVSRATREPIFVDVGCGFPPITTVESAERLRGWQVVGLDPSFGSYLLEDGDEAYASFADAGQLRYFQPRVGAATNWGALLRDRHATAARFVSLFEELITLLPPDDGTRQEVRMNGTTLVRHPMCDYERCNLRFVEGAIGTELALPHGADVVRCMNVLIYFGEAVRQAAFSWVESLLAPGGLFVCGGNGQRSTNARYTVYQRTKAGLMPREFAFGIENLRPVHFMPCYALQNDEPEVLRLVDALATLRRDEAFRREFDAVADAIMSDMGLCERRSDGYLRGSVLTIGAGAISERNAVFAERLRGAGLPGRAVSALRRAGRVAWVNCIGDVAISVADPPPLAHARCAARRPTQLGA